MLYLMVMDGRIRDARLYGIVDLGYISEVDGVRVCGELLSGGVDIVQLRAKGVAEDVIERLGTDLVGICREAGVPFIINDFPEIAVRVGADGVHVGQDDGSLADVRAVVGDEMLVGRSTHSVEQAKVALAEGFDYIGFGPLFATMTKVGRPGIGVNEVADVMAEVGKLIPVFCIGGVKRGNLKAVLDAGAERVVIVSDILLDESIEECVRGVQGILRNEK